MKTKKLLLILSFAIIITLAVCALSLTVSAEIFDGECGENVTWTLDTEKYELTVSGTGDMATEEPMPWYMCTQYINKVTVTDGITGICDGAFEDCNLLKEISLPVSVASIGENAFRNTALETITCTCDNTFAIAYAADNSYNANVIHSFGEWITTPATFEAPGKNERECEVCHIKESTEIPQLVNRFTDVPNFSWYTESALWCDTKGYMSGTTATAFSPNKPLTRAQFVQIIAKVNGVDLSAIGYKPAFTDVPEGMWFTKAVIWASDYGITGGTGGGLFSPDKRVTRQELAVFLRTYASKQGKNVSASADISKYADYESIATWARTPLAWAIGTGIMKGTTSTTLSPTITATRAQVAVIIKLFCENVLG